jgi:hypothetical protein
MSVRLRLGVQPDFDRLCQGHGCYPTRQRSPRQFSPSRVRTNTLNEPPGLSQKGIQLGKNLLNGLRWKLFLDLGASGPPVETLDLIGQNHARDSETFRDGNLKWIALHQARDRAHDRDPDLAVVRDGREHDRRAPSALLVAGPGVEIDPYDVTAVWDARPCRHQTSRPTASPDETSP